MDVSRRAVPYVAIPHEFRARTKYQLPLPGAGYGGGSVKLVAVLFCRQSAGDNVMGPPGTRSAPKTKS